MEKEGSARRASRDLPSWARVAQWAFAVLFLSGVLLRVAIDWLNHHGPSNFQGNGALVLLPLWPIVLVVGEAFVIWKKAWIAIPLLPLAIAAGTVAGGVFGV